MQPIDQLISNVPEARVNAAASTKQAGGGSIAQYNVAVWLYLKGAQGLPVSLVLSYQDGTVRRQMAVDHGTFDQQGKVLLSGIARLGFMQRISDVQIRMRTAVQVGKPIVEELFFEAVERNDKEPERSASNPGDPLSGMGLL